MAKAVLFLLILVVGGFAALLFLGSRVKPPTSASDESFDAPQTPSVDLEGVKQKAAEAGAKIKSGAKAAANKASALLEGKVQTLKFDRELVEVKAGATAEFKVIRGGGDMKAMKLELTPAPGSKITASGGEYKKGEAETTVTVKAEPGATDASLTVKADDQTKIVAVKIK